MLWFEVFPEIIVYSPRAIHVSWYVGDIDYPDAGFGEERSHCYPMAWKDADIAALFREF